MTLLTIRRVLLSLAVLAGFASAAQASPYEITDERGRRVSFDTPPARIVSLLPSLTETVCALQACERLVGVDRYSNWPQQVRDLPQLGGGIDPQIEAIVRTRPDVVLLAQSSRAADRLEALGIKVVAMEPRNHADVRRVLAATARLLGVPDERAQRVWRGIERGIADAAASLPARAREARVYIEVSRGPYAAGESSFIGETLARLGARNIVPAALGPFPKLNPEYVVRANPDLIMVGNRSMQPQFDYPGWQAIRAVREQRVCVFPDDDADIVVRPGPRMAEAARLMARCLAEKAP
ncbi:MAG: ABC transporter substrate-binding protein [Burkholderiales bacterium]|nr:ABC transporter substrate-binding protein [Burkholderiales bacterium]